jgi:hypothetical protein
MMEFSVTEGDHITMLNVYGQFMEQVPTGTMQQ